MRISKRLRLLTLQINGLFQQGEEPWKIVLLPSVLPCLLAQNGCLRQLFDQRLRQLDPLVILTLQPPDDDTGIAFRLADKLLGQFFPLLAELRIDPSLMDQSGQQLRLLGTMFGPGSRHLRSLVPTKDGVNRGHYGSAPGVLADVVVHCVVRHGAIDASKGAVSFPLRRR